jgi:phenylacetic acid degradation operon negative regulatory protein
VRRLDEAAGRIYRTARINWNGRFDLIVLDPLSSRPARARISANLAYLGYGHIGDRAWVAPRPSDEVDGLLAEARVRYDRFAAVHTAGTDGASSLVERAWDLPALAAAYERFVARLTPVVSAAPTRGGDEQAYRARFELVHAWRTFLFRDPQLPPALLPQPWPGVAAAEFFDRHAGRLRPAADRFVNHCLES